MIKFNWFRKLNIFKRDDAFSKDNLFRKANLFTRVNIIGRTNPLGKFNFLGRFNALGVFNSLGKFAFFGRFNTFMKSWIFIILVLLFILLTSCNADNDEDIDDDDFQNLALEYDDFGFILSDGITQANIVAKLRERSNNWVSSITLAPTMDASEVATKYMGSTFGANLMPYLYMYRNSSYSVNISYSISHITVNSDYEMKIIVVNNEGYGFHEEIDTDLFIAAGFNAINLRILFPNQNNWNNLGSDYSVFAYVKELSDVPTDGYSYNAYNIYEIELKTNTP